MFRSRQEEAFRKKGYVVAKINKPINPKKTVEKYSAGKEKISEVQTGSSG